MSSRPRSSEGAEIAAAVAASEVVRSWIRPEWHDPTPLAVQAWARDAVRYVVADDFFEPAKLDALHEHHGRLEYSQDDVGLNYDSTAIRVDKQPDVVGTELLLDPVWHRYAAFVLGASLNAPGRTVVKYRRHPPGSNGFWPHTDRDPEHPKALAVLGYLNRGWKGEDGGLLQLWATEPADDAELAVRWDDWENRELDFLERSPELTIEVAAELGVRPMHARVLDQVVPRYNRVVFLDFQTTPSFHSITPTGPRPREGFVQWLY